MTRIFRPNAYFEEELLTGDIFPIGLEGQNAVVESCFLVLTGPEKSLGEIIAHSTPEERWYSYWKKKGWSIASPVRIFQRQIRYELISEPIILGEWGKISQLSTHGYFTRDPSSYEESFRLSSKIQQSIWKANCGIEEFPAWTFQNEEAWQGAINLTLNFPLYVRKLDFGFSGRHEFVLPADLGSSSKKDFFKTRNTGSILEPWVDRIQDFSLLFSAQKGDFRLEASTLLLSNSKGKYSGTWIAEASETEQYLNQMEGILERLREFAPAYSGFGSIDSFIYREGSNLRLRKISEVNFRWTMGRVLRELQKKFPLPGYRDLALFVSHKNRNNRDPYSQLLEWEKNSSWRIFPLSAFFSESGKPNPKVLLWFRIPKAEVGDPFLMAEEIAGKSRATFGS
ncbi:hypothetical protein LEP1GSC050_3108 [Leptospira broomii serovar Hurstbridge str. 5399]|uniref:ATP-grasp domain protein n=1 Tax=Leptospira broomii serovar Hurstbridge str. 5399 TaxID=1049789 RepID=T0GK44_9LEPT|nr:hypothetical protein [Leptospira broomii]EQA45743.1 hypothetical protein LEP1GSC050_3108 [Leptospira broomii serovar Hurstbridge str. 5399]